MIYGKVINKKLVLNKNSKRFIQYILNKLNDKKVIIEIKEWKKNRSEQQNKYYWGAVLPFLEEETGNDTNDLHDFFKTKFLRKRISINGKERIVIGSTTQLNTVQFNEYLEKIRLLTNVNFPPPTYKD